MKYVILLMVSLNFCLVSLAQQVQKTVVGKVSYKSSQNIYCKFDDTNGIENGDTLFISRNNKLIPAIKVSQKSSVSIVGVLIGNISLNVNDNIVAQPKIKHETDQKKEIANEQDYQPEVYDIPKPAELEKKAPKYKQDISGKIALSSYSNLTNTDLDNNHRFRYTFALDAEHVDNSKLSLETYMRFSHQSGEWSEVQSNIFNALKIYDLSARYDFTDHAKLWLGRKVNPKIANAGAIDGVQFEQGIGNFSIGAFTGFRPDYQDYGFNSDLLQYGVYIDHQIKSSIGNMQNTLAFFEQKYKSNTDRRFIYFQHSNSLLKNLFFFGSIEMDMYQLDQNQSTNNLDLTSMYLSLRYRASKKLSLTASYDRRKNVIYYETFKSLAYQILENETRQGYRFRANYRLNKNMSFGANMGYRSRSEEKDSKNFGGYVYYRNLPGINANANLSTTQLRTNYLKGQIYRLRLYKDLIPGKLYGSARYSYVNYKYQFNNDNLLQNIANLELSWNIARKFSFSADYEQIFQKSDNYSRLYLSLIKRF